MHTHRTHISKTLFLILTLLCPWQSAQADPPSAVIDIAKLTTINGTFERVSGAFGDGHFGVPVAGGYDVNNDGLTDGKRQPFRRNDAGQVYLILGDGTIDGSLEIGQSDHRIIRIYGDGNQENTGSEVWMDDVTGDGLGDLLIARQNFDAGSRLDTLSYG